MYESDDKELTERLAVHDMPISRVHFEGQRSGPHAAVSASSGLKAPPRRAARRLVAEPSSHPEISKAAGAKAHVDLAPARPAADDNAEALAFFESAVRLAPHDRAARRQLADFYLFPLKRYLDAMKLYCELLAGDPSDCEVLHKIGTLCAILGRRPDAIYFFRKVLSLEPWDAVAWHYIDQSIDERLRACGKLLQAHEAFNPLIPSADRPPAMNETAADLPKAFMGHPNDHPLVSIIILTFNQLAFTKQCIESICKHTPEAHEIIFIDNASSDGTGEWLREAVAQDSRYRLVENRRNLGFAAGNNLGISLAQGRYILLLNNDVVVTPGWLQSLIAVAEQDECIGLVGPKSNRVPGPQQIERIGYDPETLDGLELFSRKWAERWRGKSLPYWRIVGFCMLIKKKVIEKIGGLDPQFEIGNFEDDDFCLRAYLAGFRSRIAEDCFVHHFGAKSFTGNCLDYVGIMERNWQIFKKKWGLAPETDFRSGYTVATGQIHFDARIHYVPVNNPIIAREQANAGYPANAAGQLRTPGPSHPDRTDSSPPVTPSKEAGAVHSSVEDMYAKAIQTAQSGQYQEAIGELEKIVDKFPEFALAHNDLGVLYYNTGNKSQALWHYEKSVQLEPDNITFKKNLADFYFIEENRTEDALRIYVDVLAEDPDDIEGLWATARICEKIGKFEDAQGFYERILKKDTSHPEAHARLTAIAARRMDRLSASDPGDLYEEALHSASAGDIQTAIEKLNLLISAHPGHATAWNDLGVLYYRIGDKEHAVACYEQAVGSEPDNITFAKNLADFYYIEQGRLEDALQLYRSVIRVADRDIESLTAAGRICAALKFYDESKRYFEQVRRIDATNEEAAQEIRRLCEFCKIDLLLQQNRYGEAMAEIESAIVGFGIDDGLLSAALAVRERVGPHSTQNHGTGKKRISLCMIVKNEESDLPRCLASVKPILDEIIVVDTGSTDRTRQLATAFGAQVYEIPWANDFSQARNFSLLKASGDWILILDADEVISRRDLSRIQRLVECAGAPPVAYSLSKRHYMLRSDMMGWQANQGEYPEEEKGLGWCSSSLVRLFPNDPRIRFHYPVHELVEPSLTVLKMNIRDGDIPIHHYGKLREAKTQRKTRVYRDLGRKKVKATRNSVAAIRELAIQSSHLGHHEEALKLWKQFVKRQRRSAEAYVNMGTSCWHLGRYAQALAFAQKALQVNPLLKEAQFNRALALLMMGKAGETQSILQLLLERKSDYPAAQFMLSVAYACIGEAQKVEGQLQAIRKTSLEPYLGEAFLDIAQRLFAAGRVDYARRILETAAHSKYANDQMAELLLACRAAACAA